MKALVFSKKRIKLKKIPIPKPKRNEALIKVIKAGICNTDLEILKGYMNFEGVLGHEFVGIVVESEEKKWIGKRVVGEINIGCGICDYCLKDKINHCPSRKVLGILNKNGVFSEYVTLPLSNLHVVPDKISDRAAVFTEPLAAALRILEQIKLSRKDKVLILGDGKLGLLIAQVIKRTGVNVYCIGKHKKKLKILEEKGIKTLLAGEGIAKKFDIVIEATGNREGFEMGLNYTKPEGKIILKSTYSGNINTDISAVVINEFHIIGSRCGPFDKALKWLEKDLIDVESLIDGEYSLDEWKKAFSEARKSENLKILFAISQ